MRIASTPMQHTLRLIEGKRAGRAANPVESRIRDFLFGDSTGSQLFAALYGHTAREPIPERLRLAVGLASDQERLPPLVNLA
jgi:hypothetical protein